MDRPRWIADEMLGRLARYLRFVGGDTLYLPGVDDEELVRLSAVEDRVLLTRDRQLSQRTERAFRLESPMLPEQWRAVRHRWPDLPTTVVFERCTLCNGELGLRPAGSPAPASAGVPAALEIAGGPIYVCERCGHLYWEGSHTAHIRQTIAAWERATMR